ncbi:AAA family ATPase [Pseudoroseicyclus aestuarii]|nr:AAA family ATPase [Pseudoroseicyclus aestuarii]
MTSSAAVQPQEDPIIACTISRNVQDFELLIEDMEAILGETWGDLGFEEALAYLQQPEAESLEFVAVALNSGDESNLPLILEIIAAARSHGIKVILIADEVSPASLHRLLREGGNEFVPYPLPEGELAQAIDRLRGRGDTATPPLPEMRNPMKPRQDRAGAVLAVQSMAGGTGATTLAVNLAWELTGLDKKNRARVCLLDLDLQRGSVATYLDLSRRDAVIEVLADTEVVDSDSFLQAMQVCQDRLHVLTSPGELVPLDLVSAQDVARLIELARAEFDYVIIDMPGPIVDWTEAVLEAAHVCFATLEIDMRSAQNTLRVKRALQAEDLPYDKIRYVLNRAPGFADLNGKSRIKRLEESLSISIEVRLPDGGKMVAQTCDQGLPLASGQPRNALRKEIARLARSIEDLVATEDKAEPTRKAR